MGKKAGGSFGVILTHMWTNIAVQTGGTLDATYRILQEAVKRKVSALQGALDMLNNAHQTSVSNLIRALRNPSGMSWNSFWRGVTLCGYTHARITITLTRQINGRVIKTVSTETEVDLGRIDPDDSDDDEDTL